MSFSNDPASNANQLPISIEIPDDLVQMQEILSILLRKITQVVNTKEGGLYTLQELINFQQYFTAGNPLVFRNVYRTVVNFGALPNAGSKSVAHNIQGIDPGGGNPSTFSFTHIYATASRQVSGNIKFIPIPYVSTTEVNEIGISVDPTFVTISTSINYSDYTICYVVLEYLKN